jgi:hypothetical protein
MSDYFDFPVNGQIAIDISSSGDNNIISMQSYLSEKYPNSDLKDLNLRRIFVTHYFLTVNDFLDIKFKSNTTDITGPIRMGQVGTQYEASHNSPACFWANKGEDLLLNLSDAVQISGNIVFYIK